MFKKLFKLNTISIVLTAFLISAFITFCLPAPRAIALTTEILKPTNWTFNGKGTNGNPTYAYDFTTGGDSTTYNSFEVGFSNADPTMRYHTWQTSSNTHSARRLYIRRSGTGNSDDTWSISYSINGGTNYTIIESGLLNPAIGTTTAVTIPAGLDLSLLYVKIATSKSSGPDGGYAYIYDVWLAADFTSVPKVGTQISGSYPIVVNPTTFTPQQEWTTVTVPVWHGETLARINSVTVKVFFDSAGSNPSESGFSANVQTCAILTWTRGGSPIWNITPAGTTWAINTAGCSKPSDAVLQGNWVFSFKIGKVATYSGGASDWDVYARATDYNSATSSDYLRNTEMNWYGEVLVNTVDVSWTTVAPGIDFGESTKQTDISVTYIANGPYYQKVAATTTWIGGLGNATLNTGGTPGSMEFSIKADDTDNLTAAVLLNAYPTYVTINSAGTQTSESGNEVYTNTLWLKLGNITTDTFSGVVYYMISATP
ncbi:MAG: hypothetical protein A2Y89_02280 [Chloroflexi bacterium RBG_13_51_18]|nr:MAG: hypothetical protein A2Y89_02280 [Chloroflexi bacterium RBG_13_51_18]